jgi:hypothetical protein
MYYCGDSVSDSDFKVGDWVYHSGPNTEFGIGVVLLRPSTKDPYVVVRFYSDKHPKIVIDYNLTLASEEQKTLATISRIGEHA